MLGRATDQALTAIAAAGRAVPVADPAIHGVEVIRDVPYRGSGRRAHLLDVYRPIAPVRTGPIAKFATLIERTAGVGPVPPRAPGAARPVVLYVHGGGFGILTKDSHWLLALIFARRGYVVFNISYRLAPAEPFPAAIEDVCAAYDWIVRNAHDWGGDPGRIVLAGEPAGGNLVTALALAACYRRDEPFARRVWATGVVPRAVLPTSAIFQVSDCERFGRRRPLPRVVTWILEGVGRVYLRGPVDSLDLADPVCALERGVAPDRPLPPFFTAVGTRDPLLDDTRRLSAALAHLGAQCEARYYTGAIHAFHAAIWRRTARAYWRDAFAFLARHV